jgi:hypothetical protein
VKGVRLSGQFLLQGPSPRSPASCGRAPELYGLFHRRFAIAVCVHMLGGCERERFDQRSGVAVHDEQRFSNTLHSM